MLAASLHGSPEYLEAMAKAAAAVVNGNIAERDELIANRAQSQRPRLEDVYEADY